MALITVALPVFAVVFWLAVQLPDALAYDADTPARFSGDCIVQFNGVAAFHTTVWSEDLPLPGQNNRFRLTLHTQRYWHTYRSWADTMPTAHIADYLRTEATTDGRMRVACLTLGAIEIVPHSPAVRAVMAAAAPAWEIRPHRLTLSYSVQGDLEILIEEPSVDFTGQYSITSPSPAWQADHLVSLQLLSHAH